MPVRKRSWKSKRFVFVGGTVCSAVFILIGATVHEGIIGNAKDESYAALVERLRGNHGLHTDCEKKVADSANCKTSEQPEILLWGDSYAMHLAQGFVASNSDIKIKQVTVSQCAPIVDLALATAIHGAQNCIDGNDRVVEMIRKSESIKYVVLSSPNFLLGHKIFATKDGIKELNSSEVERYFVRTLEKINELGKVAVIFSPPPRNGQDLGYCVLKAKIRGVSEDACNFSIAASEESQKKVRDMLRRLSVQYQVVWLENGICEDGICKASVDEVFIYRDSGHLSYEGSAYVGRRMGFYNLVTQYEDTANADL